MVAGEVANDSLFYPAPTGDQLPKSIPLQFYDTDTTAMASMARV